MVWTSRGNGEPSAYCSPILVEHNGTRLIVTMTAESVLGIDAGNGTPYWRIGQRQRHKINANSPLYQDGKIFCASARADSIDGHLMIQLSDDGKSAREGWRNDELYNLIGGIIVHEGFLFSSGYNKKEFYCMDAATGKINYISDRVHGGAMIYADGLFYCYGTDGILYLADADEQDCQVTSSFEIPLGTKQHWAHPVIHDRRLFMRHGDALMCYDIDGNTIK
jgi:outer membrane protein assembly factor BamB